MPRPDTCDSHSDIMINSKSRKRLGSNKRLSRVRAIAFSRILGISIFLPVISMKAGFGSMNLNYVDTSFEEMKTNEDLLLKEQAKKKSLLKDKSKY